MFGIATSIIVQRLTQMVNNQAGHAVVVHRGDPTGGILLVLLEHPCGINLFQPERHLETNTIEWRLAKENMPEAEARQWVEHYTSFDADAWVISLEGKGSDDAMALLQDLVA